MTKSMVLGPQEQHYGVKTHSSRSHQQDPGQVQLGLVSWAVAEKGLLKLVVAIYLELEVSLMILGIHFFVLSAREQVSPSGLSSAHRQQVLSSSDLPQVQ